MCPCRQGNMSGSISHYRLALQLEPGYPGGLAQLRIPSCYVKFHLAAGRQEETAGEGAACRWETVFTSSGGDTFQM